MPAAHIPPKPWTGRDDPEDGPDAKRMHHFAGDKGARALLGFACEAGVKRNKGRVGAKQGPAALRAALGGLSAPRDAEAFADLGDVSVEGDDLEDGQALLGQYVSDALAAHDRVIVLGGGHETAYGGYLGLAHRYPDEKIGVINLDAHLDLRTIGEAGPSSGTPFSQIRACAPDRFDYLCIGAAEEANTIALFDRAAEWGARVVMDKALLNNPHAADVEIAAMAQRCDIMYLTIDIDLMPHYQAPGVSAPAARGVPFFIVEHLVKTAIAVCREKKRPLPLADIVELSPPFDRDNMTAKSAALLIRRLLSS